MSAIFMEKLPPIKQMLDYIRSKIETQERLVCKLAHDPVTGGYSFEPADIFDFEGHHVIHKQFGSDDEIIRYVNSSLNREWRAEKAEGRPLWYLHVMENTGVNVAPGAGKQARQSAIMIEVNHALGDGVSFVNFIQTILTDKDGNPLTIEGNKISSDDGSAESRPPKKVRKPLHQMLAENGYIVYLATRAAFKVLLGSKIWADTMTCIKEPYEPYLHDGDRVIHTVPPISLSAIKEIKSKLKCSINDVMTSALAGAIRQYLEYRQDPSIKSSSLQIRCMVPFAFPRKHIEDGHMLKNEWLLVSVPLAVGGFATPADRLSKTKAEIDIIKLSAEPYVSRLLQTLAYNLLGVDLTVQIQSDLCFRHTLIFTNVPGFSQENFLCGQRVARVQPFITNFLPQFSVVSDAGQMHLNYVVNPKRFTDSHKLGEFYVEQLQLLAKETGVLQPVMVPE
eukprot:jgi/Hompol1/2457/HPOL_006026-RA